jgi:hypothetical protein
MTRQQISHNIDYAITWVAIGSRARSGGTCFPQMPHITPAARRLARIQHRCPRGLRIQHSLTPGAFLPPRALPPRKTRRRQPGEYAPFSGRFQAVLSPAIASRASSSVMALHEALPDGSVRSNAALSARDAGLHPAFAGSPTIARTCFMVMNMRAGVLANG